MEYILTNALLALIEYPDTTLLSVNRMFIDKAYRDKVVDYVKDPAVKAYWTEEFANYTERFAAEALPAIQNKIGQFTGNPLIRNIIGQPHSSFNIREIMDQKKILIMNLSKGLIGETNANLLGSMLTTRIYLAAMSRADLQVEEMRVQPNFYFYVDEFQSFANSTFANILSEARKYHLNLIIAHQYIAQMEEEVRDAVFGNVGTTISFRVGPFDGEVLETVYSPQFTATDLVNLGFAQIYLTLMIDGIGSQPFSASTLPPIQRPLKSSRNQVVVRSRELYASDREEVEKIVDELHMPDVDSSSNKKNGKSKGKNNTGKKKDFPAKKVNRGPQTPEDLKAILAKVAEDNGGAKKDAEEKDEDKADGDSKKEASVVENQISHKEEFESKEKREYKEGLQAELARFKNLEDGLRNESTSEESEVSQKEEEKKEQSENQNESSKDRQEEKRIEKNDRQEKRANQTRESKEVVNRESNTKAKSEKVESRSETSNSEETTDSKNNDESGPEDSRDSQNNVLVVERFRDSDYAVKDKQSKHSKLTTHKKKISKKDKSNSNNNQNRNQLKEALAGVLEEAKRKEVYKVPAFAPAADASEGGIPTVRVVKSVEETEREPKPEPEVDSSQPNTNDPLDPKKIKKMLQTSKHERSPMNT